MGQSPHSRIPVSYARMLNINLNGVVNEWQHICSQTTSILGWNSISNPLKHVFVTIGLFKTRLQENLRKGIIYSMIQYELNIPFVESSSEHGIRTANHISMGNYRVLNMLRKVHRLIKTMANNAGTVGVSPCFWNALGYCLDSLFSILWVFCNCNSLMVWYKPDIYPHMWNTLWLIVSQLIFVDVLSKGFGQVNITFRLLFFFWITSFQQTRNARRQHHRHNPGIIDRPNKRLLGYSHVRDYAEGSALRWCCGRRFVAGVERLVKCHPRKPPKR